LKNILLRKKTNIYVTFDYYLFQDDGSVLVYDLREPSTMHQNREIEKNKMSVLRSPTYITGEYIGSVKSTFNRMVLTLHD